MGRSRLRAACTTLVVLVVLGACAHDASSSAGPATELAAGGASTTSAGDPASAPPYRTQAFQPSLTVEPPSWLPPEPSADEEHFLTWTGEGPDIDRAVRFLSPVGVYDPGHRPQHLGPLPKDYVAYLLGLDKYGADISEPTSLDVDGHPATLVTAGTDSGLQGSLGCRTRDPVPDNCFGLQAWALLHIAVIEVDGAPLLAWARVVPGSPHMEEDFEAFEELLGSVHFG
jgi:hypothetical protein